MKAMIMALISFLPERLSSRLRGKQYRYRISEVPSPPRPRDARTRLYIAPVNFAGQGYRWARAAERLPDVSAVNMQYRRAGDFGYPADNSVPVNVMRFSKSWQRRQFAAVCDKFTHVLVEASRPLFGTLFDSDVEAEIRAMQSRGLKVAAASHGSDLRLPSRHRKIDEWSPFNEPGWELVNTLEEKALTTRRLLSATGVPLFVPTPELLLDWPDAQWLPIVVDIEQWSREDRVLQQPKLRVVHAPSKDLIKGTHLIEDCMQLLHDEGVIDYRVVRGVPASEMPSVYGEADIVIDQFRIGTYATAAIEAMAAGRIVIAHIHEQVRNHIRDNFSLEVPVIEATPASLEQTIRDISTHRERYLRAAEAGPTFVRELHDGTVSSQVLASFLD